MSKLNKLPVIQDLNSYDILKQLIKTHQALAELKGFSGVIPNKYILINAAMINEAKNSSEIENIVTTHDEIYKAMSLNNSNKSAKEVVNYKEALWYGYQFIKENEYLSLNAIIKIQSIIESNDAGIRKASGMVLRNMKTGEVVYEPPGNFDEIMELLNNLETYINEKDDLDELIRMAIIHYQFESIHPFYDGNGRTGRIINVLYLTLKGLIDAPIIYISKYINKNKGNYYKYLQESRTQDDLESFIIYMLKAVEETSINTLKLMKEMINLIEDIGLEIKEKLPKIYSKELINVLFYEFYTKISYVESGLSISRKTASTYLIQLEEKGILTSKMVGRDKIYMNQRLYDLVKYMDF